MLTHVLRQNFHTDWAAAWMKRQLPRRPSAVSVDERGDLVIEWDSETEEPDRVWSPDYIIKRLGKTAVDAIAVECCWRLCRHYDDHQEASKAVTTALEQRLGIKIGFAVWYWNDQHAALVSIAPAKGTPKLFSDVKTKQIEDAMSFALLPSDWLKTTLVHQLVHRAFPRQELPS